MLTDIITSIIQTKTIFTGSTTFTNLNILLDIYFLVKDIKIYKNLLAVVCCLFLIVPQKIISLKNKIESWPNYASFRINTIARKSVCPLQDNFFKFNFLTVPQKIILFKCSHGQTMYASQFSLLDWKVCVSITDTYSYIHIVVTDPAVHGLQLLGLNTCTHHANVHQL